jgi:hypothetical protein
VKLQQIGYVSISISIKDPNWLKIAKQEKIVGGKPSSTLS